MKPLRHLPTDQLSAPAGRRLAAMLLAQAACLACGSAWAVEWNDNALSYRVGNADRGSFNPNHIKKNVFAQSRASAYKDGNNYFNLDLLLSDEDDLLAPGDEAGADGASLVFRHTFDIGRIRGREIGFSALRGVGATVGFNLTTRDAVGASSRRRMLLAGPTLMWKVPGFFNTSLLLLHESRAAGDAFGPIADLPGRRNDELHPVLSASWGIPVSRLWSFEGIANVIGAKGVDEVGDETGAQANVDLQMMFDAGAALGHRKNMFRIGVEYQYWNNKFGNTSLSTAGQGFRVSRPALRAEYHF